MEHEQQGEAGEVTLALRALGYASIAVERTAVGHLQADAAINSTPARVLIDTGASATVIDRKYAERLELAREASARTASGCPGSELETVPVDGATLDELALGRVRMRSVSVSVMDLSPVNAQLVRAGGDPIDVIIGADLLDEKQAVIEYSDRRLHLRASEGSAAA